MLKWITLFLLLAFPAFSQVSAAKLRALPTDTRCPVKLPGTAPGGAWNWSLQERWAWRQICLGQVADMRFASGDRDGEKCNPADIEAEGGTVPGTRSLRPEFLALIVNVRPWSDAPAKPQLHFHCADFPKRLDLSNQSIAAELKLFGSLLRGGANLRGARFARNVEFESSQMLGRLSATALEVVGDVILKDNASFTEIDISRARISGDVDVSNTEVTGFVTANRLRVDGAIFVRDSAFVNISLENAAIGGSHDFKTTTVSGIFDANGLSVAGDLSFQDSTVGVLSLDDARIEGDLILRRGFAGASGEPKPFAVQGAFSGNRIFVAGDLRLESARVEAVDLNSGDVRHQLVLAPGSVVESDLVLRSASIGRETVLDGAAINGSLASDGAQFAGGISLRGTRMVDMDLTDARISNHLTATETSLSGNLVAQGLTVVGEVDLSGTTLSGNLIARGMSVDESVSLNNLRVSRLDLAKARIRGDLSVRNGVFYGDLITNEVQVSGDTSLSDSRIHGVLRAREAGFGGEVDLSRAHIDSIVMHRARIGDALQLFRASLRRLDLTEANLGRLEMFRNTATDEKTDPLWQNDSDIDLKNARAESFKTRLDSWKEGENWVAGDLGGFRYASLSGHEDGLARSLADEPAEALANWLREIHRTAASNRFPDRVYDQLSSVLQLEGRGTKARELRYAKLTDRNEFESKDAPWYQTAVFWPLSRWLVGYGIYPFRIAYPLIIFVMVGTFIAYLSNEATLRSSILRSLLYSFDNAVPVIELREEHKSMDLGHSWMGTFFLIQKLLGYAVVAVLTGTMTFLYVT